MTHYGKYAAEFIECSLVRSGKTGASRWTRKFRPLTRKPRLFFGIRWFKRLLAPGGCSVRARDRRDHSRADGDGTVGHIHCPPSPPRTEREGNAFPLALRAVARYGYRMDDDLVLMRLRAAMMDAKAAFIVAEEAYHQALKTKHPWQPGMILENRRLGQVARVERLEVEYSRVRTIGYLRNKDGRFGLKRAALWWEGWEKAGEEG